MPKVRLNNRECRDGGLPDNCMHCGARAEYFKDRHFAWYPPWVFVLIFAGLLPFAIVAMVMTRRLTVTLPLCEKHRNHQFNCQILALGFFLGTSVLIVLLFVAANLLDPSGNTLLPFAFLIAIVLFIAMIIGMVIVGQSQLRPTEITERSITLTNVNAAFIGALEEFRDEGRRLYDIDREAGSRWREQNRDRDRDNYRGDDRDRDQRGQGREDRFTDPKRDEWDRGDRDR